MAGKKDEIHESGPESLQKIAFTSIRSLLQLHSSCFSSFQISEQLLFFVIIVIQINIVRIPKIIF